MWLADLFLPTRVDRFLWLLDRHATILRQVASTLRSYVTDGTTSLSDDIDQLEKEGDGVLRELTNALRDAFITPIDRQDIYNLGEAIDDMIDYLNNAAREIMIFKVTPTNHMRAISQTLEEAADSIGVAVKSLKSDPQEAWVQAARAQHAENVVEGRYRTALAELFDSGDVPQILKLREVYRHLSNSADRAEAIGRLICKIVVKTT
jgi:predicted phosphate transport protein (TIGR00153 family)